MNYANEHEIYPDAPELALEPVPVQVDKYVSLSSLSRTLDMDKEQLYLINPKYRRRIVTGSGARPQTVWLHPVQAQLYASLTAHGGEARAIAVSDVGEATGTVVKRGRSEN